MILTFNEFLNESENLTELYDKVLKFLNGEKIVSEIFGIGSYFFHKKSQPNDIDLVVKLNIEFGDKSIFKFSDNLEKIKKSYQSKGNTLLNVFLIDSKDRKLNSVDIWFINHKGETLEDCLKDREYQIYWKKIKKLK